MTRILRLLGRDDQALCEVPEVGRHFVSQRVESTEYCGFLFGNIRFIVCILIQNMRLTRFDAALRKHDFQVLLTLQL